MSKVLSRAAPTVGDPPKVLTLLLLWLWPIYISMISDWFCDKRVYRVYGVAIILMTVFFFRILLAESICPGDLDRLDSDYFYTVRW